MNIAPFGEVTKWDDTGKDYGVLWEDPREIHRVVVTFAGDPPPRDTLALEYWQSSWPHLEIPRDAPSGAGQSGWHNIGDWFQGQWKTADTDIEANGNVCTFTFRALNEKEFPDLKDLHAQYRTTFKVRVTGQAILPEIGAFEVYTDSVFKPMDIEIEWGGNAADSQIWDGRLEAFNGVIEKIQPVSGDSAVHVGRDGAWKSKVVGACDGIRARIQYAETRHYNSFDETVITVRTAGETFSFAPVDLLKWGHIVIPDFGVIVRQAGLNMPYKAAERACRESAEKDLYARVKTMPEQTFVRAWSDMPAKGHYYIPLSFEGSRQHFGMDGEGNVFCNQNWIRRLPGKDSDRCLWKGDVIAYRFGLPASSMKDRTIVDGCLPMTVTVWENAGIRYKQTAFAIPLAGVPPAGEAIRADDTLVLMIRFDMELLEHVKAEARLELDIRQGEYDETLGVNRDRVIVPRTKPRRLRMLVADQKSLTEDPDCVLYRTEITRDAPERQLDIVIPYITFTDPEEGDDWQKLRALQFDTAFEDVREYWHRRLDEGAQIQTPEPMVNDFYKAHVSHLLINTEREASGSERYMAKVGTFHYGVYANEACMMVSDLDRRGYHQRAEQAIETWLHYQGSHGLPGDYASTEGEFYGAGGYEDTNGYNQHHGWVLWCLGEHYWMTRDAAWLKHAAPHIVKACDWIINERQRTIEIAERSPIRAIERGLLPQGSLEDIADWRNWMSNNVYSWWGMDNAARALAAAGHPDGERLCKEAAAYKQDLWAAFAEAMRRSPVVRLRDGSWIPNIPSEVHRRGRCFGWITETLEGSIQLVRCGVLEPEDRISTWILEDYEDNRYISEQYGYDIKGEEFDRYWFSRGGISMQANLLCHPIPYLLRDEIPHYLRGYFNAFAVSYFSDTRMMTEHALPSFGDFRGDHYKTSDEANSTFWLRLMFIEERGEDLRLCMAIPRYWLADGQQVSIENAATYFGPMSLWLESHVADGRMRMELNPPRRNPPRRILVRFRHPQNARMIRCEVNGKSVTSFDPEKEWVELTDCTGPTEIVAYYQ